MTREAKNTISESQRNFAEYLRTGKGTLRQFSRKQHFIAPAQTQWSRVQRLSPQNKGVLPYIP
jgi:hypothetical protein